jgi:molybdopterin-binding protein
MIAPAAAGAYVGKPHLAAGDANSGQAIRTPQAKASQMEISARNQFRGRVTAVRTGGIMAEVEVQLDAPPSMLAAITKSSVERLALAEGDAVTVIIKSTEVLIGK